MKGFKEFNERIESDAAFTAKFKDAKTDEQIIALAKAEGYNLEQLSENELEHVAGGINLDPYWSFIKHKLGL